MGDSTLYMLEFQVTGGRRSFANFSNKFDLERYINANKAGWDWWERYKDNNRSRNIV